MSQGKFKQTPVRSRRRKQTAGAAKNKVKSRAFFKREAQWMTWMNLAPFGVGFVLALIFWFTR